MKGRLLIVDDQQGIRLLLTDVFTHEGYIVRTAQNGQIALDKIFEESFDLIILDDQLPILTGREVLKQMRDNQNQTPVILMSGLIEDLQQELKVDHLLLAIVAKPFNIKDVCEFVNQALQTDSLQRNINTF